MKNLHDETIAILTSSFKNSKSWNDMKKTAHITIKGIIQTVK